MIVFWHQIGWQTMNNPVIKTNLFNRDYTYPNEIRFQQHEVLSLINSLTIAVVLNTVNTMQYKVQITCFILVFNYCLKLSRSM